MITGYYGVRMDLVDMFESDDDRLWWKRRGTGLVSLTITSYGVRGSKAGDDFKVGKSKNGRERRGGKSCQDV